MGGVTTKCRVRRHCLLAACATRPHRPSRPLGRPPPVIEVVRAAGADAARSGRVVVGPEGDFTDEEIDAMVAAGARPIGLGSLRLRVETACVSALAAVSAVAEESSS